MTVSRVSSQNTQRSLFGIVEGNFSFKNPNRK